MASTAEQRTSGRSRTLVVLAALAGWCALIVVGAGRRADESTWLGVEHLDVLFLSFLGLAALVGLVLIIVLRPYNLEWSEPEKRRSGSIGIAMLAVLVLLWWRPSLLDPFVDDAEETEQAVPAAPGFEDDEAEIGREPVAQVSHLLGVAAIAAMLAGIWYLSRRDDFQPPVPTTEGSDDDGSTHQLVVAIEQASERLAAPGDSRTAVMAAYAMLEAEFDRRGRTRRAAETTTEHVRRVLRDLPVDVEPVVQLARLYELARFSHQPITFDDQQRAARALAAARSEPAAGA